MRDSAMSPEVTIENAESETDHIEVRNDGTHDASQPDRLGDFGSIEARSDTEGYDRMRECRCHYFFVSSSCSTLRSWTWREYFYPRFPNRDRIASEGILADHLL